MRQLREDPWTSILLAVLVAIMTLLATLGPRLLTDLNARQLDYTVTGLSVLQRDIRATETIEPAPLPLTGGSTFTFTAPTDTWALVNEGLRRVRARQPEPLRSVLQPGRFYVDVDTAVTGPDDPDSDIASYALQFRVDPLLSEVATLEEGDWPKATLPDTDILIEANDEPIDPDDALPVEIALNQTSAERLVWEVGEERDIGFLSIRLAGIYTADDPASSHWQQSPFGADLGTFFDGNIGITAKATAYLAPGNPGALIPGSARNVHAWFSVDASDVSSDDVSALTAQIGAFTVAEVTVVDPELASPQNAMRDFRPRFLTEISGTLRDVAAEQRATASILAVISAGPIGVAASLFALGGTLLVSRRRGTVGLATARGSSVRQVGGVLMAEGGVLGLLAATIGYAVAGLIQPPSPSAATWPPIVVAVGMGLSPAVAIGIAILASGARSGLRATRSDLGSSRRRGRTAKVRIVTEVAVLAVAALATWQLLERGLGDITGEEAQIKPVTEAGVDPLLAATPLLLALAAAVLTLRVYPLPMRGLARALHARVSLTPFLGAAGDVRDPAGGLVPALVMVLGVSVITFSTVLSSTIVEGAQRAAWNANGAQIRMSGPQVSDELIEIVRAVPGVADVALVAPQTRTVNVIGENTDGGARVFVVSDSLAQVHAAAPLVEAFDESLYNDSADNDSLSQNP
ncbi:MAG: hypothetical protein H0U62_11700, partial [Actinobacteria bacterium]|nr:hypothetical protein [Actinomycetota bacterium]